MKKRKKRDLSPEVVLDTDQKISYLSGKLPRLSAINEEQRDVIKSIIDNDITFIHGPAGSGKTHIPTVYGAIELKKGTYKRLILTRPCVEAYGESIGFLPGTANDKISPYMMPMLDILGTCFSNHELTKLIESKIIMMIPLAFHRGLTFREAFVIGDEFQNATVKQLRLFLTRIGHGSKLVVTGDLSQSDITDKNGLQDAIERFSDMEKIGICSLTEASTCARHPLIQTIERQYSDIKN